MAKEKRESLLKEQRKKRAAAKKENQESEKVRKQLADLQKQADLLKPIYSTMPIITIINKPKPKPTFSVGVVPPVVIRKEFQASAGEQEPQHDIFSRRPTRPRKMGSNPVIAVEVAPAETVEMMPLLGSHGIEAEIVELDDMQVETSNAASDATVQMEVLVKDFFTDDSDFDSSSDESLENLK